MQSLADGSTSPYADPGTLAVPSFLVLVVMIWFAPRCAEVRSVVLGALIGAAIAGALYASFRPTSLTGPISTGAVITVILPFDWVLAASVAVYSGCAGWMLAIVLGRLRRRLAGR